MTGDSGSVITCLPKSLCSWSFVAAGTSAGAVSIECDWLTEQGRIVIGAHCHEIRKHGAFSGRWTMEHRGQVVADARKPSAILRRFDIATADLRFALRASSPVSRGFEIVVNGRPVGRIQPVHAFTRRAVVVCPGAIPEPIQLFAFWLVVLTWRRSVGSSA